MTRISVHCVQRVICASSIRSSQGIHWGTRPLYGKDGLSIAPEIWHVGGTLAGCRLFSVDDGETVLVCICDGHIGGEQIPLPPGLDDLALRNR